MKNLALVASVICLCGSSAFAQKAPETDSSSISTLEQGHWSLGGSTRGHVLRYANYFNYRLAGSVQYFLVDSLSLGLAVDFAGYSGDIDDTWYVGPAFRWYFWSEDQIAAHLGASYEFKATGDSDSFITIEVGPDFFFNENVSFAPLATAYITDGSDGFGVAFAFTVHL